MSAETVVLSPALVDRDAPVVIDPMLLRALKLVGREVDPDYAASVKDGLTESFEAFSARIGGRP